MIRNEASLFAELVKKMVDAERGGQDVVLFTSRGERAFQSTAQRLAFGERVSAFLMRLVRNMPRVVGQIRAGCSVVVCPDEHPR